VSPTHDFNLSGKKILESLEVSCEPLPAGCSIDLAYSLDGAAFVSATIATGTGTTGGKLTISTDSSTKTFRNLQLKVTLNGASNLTPTLKSIDAYARVNRRVNVWDLLLDCTDDAAPQGYSGAQLIDNITALAENTVYDFVDNYDTHTLDGGTTYDVVLDSADVILSQQGEGFIQVRLAEVI
jgi:hypothetical protein